MLAKFDPESAPPVDGAKAPSQPGSSSRKPGIFQFSAKSCFVRGESWQKAKFRVLRLLLWGSQGSRLGIGVYGLGLVV